MTQIFGIFMRRGQSETDANEMIEKGKKEARQQGILSQQVFEKVKAFSARKSLINKKAKKREGGFPA